VAKRERNEHRSPSTIPPELAEAALIGRTLDDRYRIDAPLAAGGMGAVYRGTHLKLGSPVAIKLLLDQYASSRSLRKRFEREAKALAGLRHPNIVAVSDYGLSGDVPYLVMELLEGETLGRRLKRGPFPHAQVQELIGQLLRALSFVHEQGLVHRDLKPGNVFFQRLPDGEERLKLLDFGLAKVVEPEPGTPDSNLTLSGEAVGTPAYMAPEQISGGPAGAGSDVYAVGVMFFQLLCGRLPFEGEPMEQLKSHLVAPIPSLSGCCPAGPLRPELETWLEHAMAKQPEARFRDGAEMLAALEAVPLPWAVVAQPQLPSASDAMAVAATLLDARGTAASGAAGPVTTTKPVALPPRTDGDRGTDVTEGSGRSWRARAFVLGCVVLAAALAARSAWQGRSRVRPPHAVVQTAVPPAAPRSAAMPEAAAPPSQAAAPEPAPVAAVAAPVEAVAPAPAVALAAATEAEPAEGSTDDAAPIPAADAVQHEGPVRPVAPRPPARNPWTRGTPKGLRTLRKILSAGAVGTDRGISVLRRYSHDNPGDPRGPLLLARLYMNRHWRTDALREYGAVYRIDASARGAPQMLSDLLALVVHGAVADEAARLIHRAYGGEALPAIDRLIHNLSSKADGQKRLHALRVRIAG
jgi:hypothetical protein